LIILGNFETTVIKKQSMDILDNYDTTTANKSMGLDRGAIQSCGYYYSSNPSTYIYFFLKLFDLKLLDLKLFESKLLSLKLLDIKQLLTA